MCCKFSPSKRRGSSPDTTPTTRGNRKWRPPLSWRGRKPRPPCPPPNRLRNILVSETELTTTDLGVCKLSGGYPRSVNERRCHADDRMLFLCSKRALCLPGHTLRHCSARSATPDFRTSNANGTPLSKQHERNKKEERVSSAVCSVVRTALHQSKAGCRRAMRQSMKSLTPSWVR